MIQRRGIIQAVERVVARHADSQGYRTLERMGLQRMAFEAVVLKHEHAFSAKAVAQARARLEAWESGDPTGEVSRRAPSLRVKAPTRSGPSDVIVATHSSISLDAFF